jgi:uncharacterized protein
MKPSYYNFTFPFGDGKLVMYNSCSNALALIEEEKYAKFIRLCETSEPIEDEKLERDLKAGAYLVDDDVDELALLRLNMLKARYNTSSLGLTIAPTSDCNFRCVYCYEKDSIKPVTMTAEVQDKLIEFVESRAKTLANLSVSWYGGEPLLALDIVESLTKRFKALCEKHEISYSHGMITNGYLLTKNNIARLKKLGLGMMQVTLDGPPEDHDARRYLKGQIPTFDKIISNLRNARNSMPCPVNLRINIDRSNADKVDRLINILRENELENAVYPYLGMVENHEETYIQDICFQSSEFSSIDLEYRKRYNTDTNGLVVSLYPRLIRNFCGADSTNGHVINADGRIYQCWSDIGIVERCTGNLIDSSDVSRNTYLGYMLYDPTTDAECKECKYLPICMGGCPARRMYNRENRCSFIKYRMAEYMSIIPKILNVQRQQKTLHETGS